MNLSICIADLDLDNRCLRQVSWEIFEPVDCRNQFLFRCGDGVLVDGSDGLLSGSIHRSCAARDQVGSSPLCR
jgi:hypothetical protein